ncbi:uncharacterized protein LOC117241779 [Bombus vosnesenskii]|uniref:Uncharacterized protein LOC117241779 n=1 Tax=Bombus vosnesenskii TaxID=207650 RepID=A0A6J3LEJ6_9HYME|nr:uncharacterized protein LOC117241779 [Bombus vosnesenskii]
MRSGMTSSRSVPFIQPPGINWVTGSTYPLPPRSRSRRNDTLAEETHAHGTLHQASIHRILHEHPFTKEIYSPFMVNLTGQKSSTEIVQNEAKMNLRVYFWRIETFAVGISFW